MEAIRKTYIMKPENIDKVKKHSEKTGIKISAVVNQAIEKFFKGKK